MSPGCGDERLAALPPDLPQPEDELRKEPGRDRREDGIRGHRDDQRREQDLVYHLRDDKDAECAGGPDEVVVEAERGSVVLLQEAAFRLPWRKQPPRHAIAETCGGYCGNQSLGDLLDADCQQAERIECEQACGGCQPHAQTRPTTHT